MPSISQQDYLRIEIEDTSALTDTEKAAIQKNVDNGTIFDTIFSLEGGHYLAKASSVNVEAKGINLYTEELIELDYS